MMQNFQIIHKQLHELESEFIEINGLMKALQLVLPDGEAHICVANVLEDRLRCLQQQFYKHWGFVTEKPENSILVDNPETVGSSPINKPHN